MTLRIYADFNGLVAGPRHPGSTAVVLDTLGSLRDLCNAGVMLTEGMPLIGFVEGAIEEFEYLMAGT